MQKFPKDWDLVTQINYLQRKIIITSIAYYEFNESHISDMEYDSLCKQLVELQSKCDVSATQYGYVFYDFDGSTGFDLRDRLFPKDKAYLTRLTQLFGH